VFDFQFGEIDRPIELNDEVLMLIDGWDAFHCLEFMGYSFKQFMELSQCESTIFSDEVTSCHECGEWMHNDNGYTYNYRIVDGELLGLECGCYAEHMKEHWHDRVNDPKVPIELEVAEELEESGTLEHLERFIGGMTDGRGGYFNGESCSEGNPEEVLADYQQKYPDKQFLFTHDESGQFQTYFSIWEVVSN
jgi:hypothetical protein